MTTATGLWSFSNLAADTYFVTETNPSGYSSTAAIAGTNGASVVNADQIKVVLAAGATSSDNKFLDTANQADLSIAKDDGVSSVVAGNSTTYTITVSNAGPSNAAAGVVVSDSIPAGTSGSESEADCAIASGTFTCTTAAAIAAGGSKSYQLTLNVSAGFSGASLTNTATISAVPAGTTDPDSSDYSASDTDTVTKQADLSIAKDDGVSSVVAGNSTTYTITVSNAGPSNAAAGVVVSDSIPAGTSGSESEADCAIASGTFTCTTAAAIAAGGSKSYQLTLNVSAGFSGASLTNTATISAVPAGTTDPDSSDYSASDTDTVTKQADLSIAKDDGVSSVVAGNSTTYTITVSNAGPSNAAAGVVVSDSIPAGTSGSESEADCAIASGTFTCTTAAAIAAGGSKSYQLTLNVSAGFSGASLTNTATISAVPAGTTDPDSSDYSASDTDTVTKQADLSIAKDDGVSSVVAGNSTTYTITVSNAGPSNAAAGVVVSDSIPAGTSGSESEADCAIASGTFTCTTAAAIAAGGSRATS